VPQVEPLVAADAGKGKKKGKGGRGKFRPPLNFAGWDGDDNGRKRREEGGGKTRRAAEPIRKFQSQKGKKRKAAYALFLHRYAEKKKKRRGLGGVSFDAGGEENVKSLEDRNKYLMAY